MYFVEIKGGKITAKGEGPFLTDEQIEVSEKIYFALTNLPASFAADKKGQIITVKPDPVPAPPEMPEEKTDSQRIADLEKAVQITAKKLIESAALTDSEAEQLTKIYPELKAGREEAIK